MNKDLCRKSILHIQLYFYYRGMRRFPVRRKDIIEHFRKDVGVSDTELTDENAERVITSFNLIYFKKDD